MWHAVKFLCQELDEKTATNLGHELSALNDVEKDEFEKYRRAIIEIIFRRLFFWFKSNSF